MLAATLDQAIYIYETQPLKQVLDSPVQDSFERAPLQDQDREDREDG